MKIAILTEPQRRFELQQLLLQLEMPGLQPSIFYNSYDDFISELPCSGCDHIIVAQDGANGMESARAARILQPRTPLIWLSNDKAFGPESYRVGCSYFSAAPITADLLRRALRQCRSD